MMINRFDTLHGLTDEITEAFEYYIDGGIPEEAIRLQVSKTKWSLRVDINRVLPHLRKAIIDAVAHLEFQEGKLHPLSSVIFPKIRRVESTLTMVEMVSAQPMEVPTSYYGRSFYMDDPRYDAGNS